MTLSNILYLLIKNNIILLFKYIICILNETYRWIELNQNSILH